jgi:hypothetical protein
MLALQLRMAGLGGNLSAMRNLAGLDTPERRGKMVSANDWHFHITEGAFQRDL